MKDFIYYVPTEVYFGKKCLNILTKSISRFGSKALFVYGQGSIKQSGLYDTIVQAMNDYNLPFCELPGVKPNPRIESVRHGIAICKEKGCDVILAVGGGSAIDCAKAIAAGYYYEGDVWDLVEQITSVSRTLPVITISTLSGSGSEMSAGAVISDITKRLKYGFSDFRMRPKVSFLNPELTFSVNRYQTASGIADAFSHAIECYFSNVKEAYLQARLGEAIMKTLVRYGKIACEQPNNYEARANIMWASTWAINGLLSCGNPVTWSLHEMEHELSAYYDITHGATLAVLIPAWMRWMLREENLYRYMEFSQGVFDINILDLKPMEAAHTAIWSTQSFFKGMDLPIHLREMGVDFETLGEMASNIGDNKLKDAFMPLKSEDILEIYQLAY